MIVINALRPGGLHEAMKETTIPDMAWLSNVQEGGPMLTQAAPIWVRHFVLDAAPDSVQPECHPYCELGLHLTGSGVEYVEREQAVRNAGDLFFAAPGLPHWFDANQYPVEGIAIYFLPSVLCDWGPVRDGIHILRRFTSRQHIDSRLISLPPTLAVRMRDGFVGIREECESKDLGYEIRLRTILMDMLVDLVRWERQSGAEVAQSDPPAHWQDVNRALLYLREHFTERVYADDVAKAVGISQTRLRNLFRETLGTPWSRYIQGYRIQQAIALLISTDRTVTEVAQMVGFDSLSHFNTTFRAFIGVSPTAYLKTNQKPKTFG